MDVTACGSRFTQLFQRGIVATKTLNFGAEVAEV
jgi:hypothetical protein